MDMVLTCGKCGAKLKVNASVLAAKKDVRCAKCRQPIPLPDAAPLAKPKAAPKMSGPPTISFPCAKCARKIVVMRSLAGKKVKCPGCAEVNAVPEEVPPAPGAPAAEKADTVAPAAVKAPPDDLEARVRELAEQVTRLQEELARERGEIAACAAELENLKRRLAAGQ